MYLGYYISMNKIVRNVNGMKLNRKGFTLIEMLAVVVILGILMAIMTSVVGNLIEENKKNNFESLKSGIFSATKNYLSDFRYEIAVKGLPCNNSNEEKDVASVNGEVLTDSKLPLQSLVSKKYLKGDVRNPFNRESLNLNKVYVVIKYSCKRKDYSYSIQDDSGSGLTWN